MRGLTLASLAVLFSAGAALVVALFAVPEVSRADEDGMHSVFAVQLQEEESASEAQYDTEIPAVDRPPQEETPPELSGGDTSENTAYYTFYNRWLARESDPPEVAATGSEGSAPGARAPYRALSAMQPSKPYSQIVDNASPKRFQARGWKESSAGDRHYAKDYSYVTPGRKKRLARFRVRVPATGFYTVYARWPAARENNTAARFGVRTPSGVRWTTANQRRDGGMWVRLGAYRIREGDRYVVQVAGRSKKEGRVVADAVMVVRGTQAAPPERTGEADHSRATRAEGSSSGFQVIRRARAHIGTPYRHSPPLPCKAYRSEDCSCLTKLVFSPWAGLPDDPVQQWRVGRKVARSDLRPGDLVFFKEAGRTNPITHVGIYSGRGNIIHASTYWGAVVERPMRYVNGYYGAKRLT